jgi:hypothetical protein
MECANDVSVIPHSALCVTPISFSCSAVQLGRFSRLEQKRSSNVLHISHYRLEKHLQRLRFTAVATKIHPSSAELQDARAALQSQAQTSACCCFAAMSSTPVTVPFQFHIEPRQMMLQL